MKAPCIQLITFFLLSLITIQSIHAAPIESNLSSPDDPIPLTTDYPPIEGGLPPPKNQYKIASAVILATIATVTIGLLVSGADTGRDARISPK